MTTALEGRLGDTRYVTLILRLVLDAHGRLEHGEMVDANATLVERFIGMHGLLNSLSTWLARMEQSGNPPGP